VLVGLRRHLFDERLRRLLRPQRPMRHSFSRETDCATAAACWVALEPALRLASYPPPR
jgi:hypothetical protein